MENYGSIMVFSCIIEKRFIGNNFTYLEDLNWLDFSYLKSHELVLWHPTMCLGAKWVICFIFSTCTVKEPYVSVFSMFRIGIQATSWIFPSATKQKYRKSGCEYFKYRLISINYRGNSHGKNIPKCSTHDSYVGSEDL